MGPSCALATHWGAALCKQVKPHFESRTKRNQKHYHKWRSGTGELGSICHHSTLCLAGSIWGWSLFHSMSRLRNRGVDLGSMYSLRNSNFQRTGLSGTGTLNSPGYGKPFLIPTQLIWPHPPA